MADISVSTSLQVSKGSLTGTFARSSTTDMTTAGMLVQTLTIGTTTTQISTAGIGTLGVAFGQSLVSVTQTTATITFGRLVSGTLHETCVVRPGEAFVTRLAAGNYAAKAAGEGYRFHIAVTEE